MFLFNYSASLRLSQLLNSRSDRLHSHSKETYRVSLYLLGTLHVHFYCLPHLVISITPSPANKLCLPKTQSPCKKNLVKKEFGVFASKQNSTERYATIERIIENTAAQLDSLDTLCTDAIISKDKKAIKFIQLFDVLF